MISWDELNHRKRRRKPKGSRTLLKKRGTVLRDRMRKRARRRRRLIMDRQLLLRYNAR